MKRLEGYFPPGYEYRREAGLTGALFGLGAFFSLRFLGALYNAVSDAQRMLQESVMRESVSRGRVYFAELAAGYWAFYVPAFLFLLVMPLFHYLYFYRETRSIYVMRRLPRRGVVFKSCVQGPLIEAGTVLASAVSLYLLYYLNYRLCIGAGLLP